MSYVSSETAPQNNRCECYKKLQFFAGPLYKNEEDGEFGEGHGEILQESAFPLPGVLTIDAQITEYPVVDEDKLPFVFRQMARAIPNLSDFEVNVLSFWILDMFVEGLWTAQKAEMNHDHQRATLLWIAYLFNYVQKENPSRKQLFLHLKTVLFTPDWKRDEYSGEETKEGSLGESDVAMKDLLEGENCGADVVFELPLPPGTLGMSTESYVSPIDHSTLSDELTVTESNEVQEEEEDVKPIDVVTKPAGDETVTERNVRHMKIILEILYRIFARLWVFLEIQAVFHVMPPVEEVNLPFNLGIPKPTAKVDSFILPKVEKSGKRISFVEELSEEEELEKQLHKNDYILPLQAAEESKAYIKQVFIQPVSDRSILSQKRERRK